MSKLSENFSESEFECPCCGVTKINMELVTLLQEMRDDLGERIHITSSYRCPKHNKLVGGARKSQHLLGTAADIVVESCSPHFIYEWLDNKLPKTGGIGKYNSFTHIDVRSRKARW